MSTQGDERKLIQHYLLSTFNLQGTILVLGGITINNEIFKNLRSYWMHYRGNEEATSITDKWSVKIFNPSGSKSNMNYRELILPAHMWHWLENTATVPS